MSKGLDLGDVVALGPPKEAALYFERVLPVDLAQGYLGDVSNPDFDLNIPHNGTEFRRDVVASLLPGSAQPDEAYVRLTMAGFAAQLVRHGCSGPFGAEIFAEKIPGSPFGQMLHDFGLDVKSLIADMKAGIADGDAIIEVIAGKGMVPVVHDFGFTNAAAWAIKDQKELTGTEGARFIATMQDLNLVDVDSVSWEQVVEFRKDKESRRALRDLRLFFSENFEGKEPGYIADKLEQLVEQHDKAVKTWGLSTKVSALSVLFTKESLMGVGAAAIATQFGVPGVMAVGAGAAISVGRIGLEFTKVIVDAEKTAIDRPVRYLSHLKRTLGKAE